MTTQFTPTVYDVGDSRLRADEVGVFLAQHCQFGEIGSRQTRNPDMTGIYGESSDEM